MIQVTPEIAAGQFFDELIKANGQARPGADSLLNFLQELSPQVLSEKRAALEAAIKSQGISFLVYSDSMNIDRSWPLDLVPRVMRASEWNQTEAGLKQRLTALNLFLNDIYNEQAIIHDGVVPAELVTASPHFIGLASGIRPLFDTWAHICGSDLVRDHSGKLFVLEDNLRVPSGVSYMLENRSVMKQIYPELFRHHQILPVSQYASDLLDMLNALSPRPVDHPVIVVLTPGIYNSAYFEHSYLAQQIGAELVQGSDLFVDSDNCVYMKAVEGVSRVDVIYRRIDDTFLDPDVLNPDSVLGIPGLIRAWRAGKVSIANAPGSGVADDKVLYTYVPEIIRYYLNEEPLLDNVPTYVCSDSEQRAYVLDHLDELVVKPADASGGYGIMVGPQATDEALVTRRAEILENPRVWVAQPTLSISTTLTVTNDGDLAPRHVDLRPFVLQSSEQWCSTGGLCRVALQEGSLVVNSSQGGGSKDFWVVADEAHD
ncbi:MAG: circularly permuted type 2 ATP-grasp protein [Pseudomonadota bacterium]|nr:circularly permuted type 2 ATP-grasp protein [Pseudomonadota bacterium]MEE2821062.1 circularly permuted type 2 ATP-grasp protein [Pseudomonadota bacterium]